MKEMKRIIVVLFLCVCVCASLFAQTGGGAADKAEDLRIQKRLMGLKMDGLIPLRFAGALDNKPIAGAKVVIDGVGAFTTNREGIITFPEREDGFFTLTFSKQGFITTDIDFEIKLNNVFGNRFSISPDLPKGFRVVLDWGEKPEDLDLHLEKRGGYHISYWNMHTADDGSAALDRDDRDSFGPETITVERSTSGAVYDVYVIDYTNQGSSGSRALSQSGAAVKVYADGRLAETFTVPQNRQGTKWRVARIANGAVQSVGVVE
jgi:hypothetical protein